MRIRSGWLLHDLHELWLLSWWKIVLLVGTLLFAGALVGCGGTYRLPLTRYSWTPGAPKDPEPYALVFEPNQGDVFVGESLSVSVRFAKPIYIETPRGLYRTRDLFIFGPSDTSLLSFNSKGEAIFLRPGQFRFCSRFQFAWFPVSLSNVNTVDTTGEYKREVYASMKPVCSGKFKVRAR